MISPGSAAAGFTPWAETGVRLVVVPSWHSAPVGAIVQSVDGESVDDVSAFTTAANGSFVQLGAGEDYAIEVKGSDGPYTIRIGKKAAVAKPRPELMR